MVIMLVYVDQVSKWTRFDDVKFEEGMMSRDRMHQGCYIMKDLVFYMF
jgi:hypothetical protein